MHVARGDGQFSWSGGMCGDQPFQADAAFFIASIDKLLNASLLLMLHEEGRVDLDAPASLYLPAGMMDGLHIYRGRDYSAQIRVRHLLSHTSGLPDWLEDSPKNAASLVEQITKDGDRAIDLAAKLALIRDQLSPHFPPQPLDGSGAKIRYSDTNFLLLVAMLEHLCQQPLAAIHRQRLLEPLGMRDTWMAGESPAISPPEAICDLHVAGEVLAIPQLMASINGIYSTGQDLIRFLRALNSGALFKQADTYMQMQQHWRRFSFPRDKAALRAPNWPIEYGLGMMRFRLPRVFTPFHPMPAVIGHSGSTGCWLYYCAERDLYLAGAVNEITAGAVPYRLLPRLLRLFDE